MNSEGQKKQDVEKLLEDAVLNGQKRPDVNEEYKKSWYHSLNVSIFVRDILAMQSDDLKFIEERLGRILGGYNLEEDHGHNEHNPDCNEPSTNVFAELDAKRKIEFHKAN